MMPQTVTPRSLVDEARANYAYVAGSMPDNAVALAQLTENTKIHILFNGETSCGLEKMSQVRKYGIVFTYFDKCHKFDICIRCLATYWYKWIR